MTSIRKDLFTSAYNLDAETKKRLIRIVLGGAFLVMMAALILALTMALHKPDPDNPNPAWDVINASRAALIRLALCLPVAIAGVVGWLFTFQVFTHSEIGRRWVLHHPNDTPEVKAAKTRNAGVILAALAIAFILGLLMAVLR